MKFRVFAVCFALITLNSGAASFDCNKASTKVERSICTTADLSRLDDELATQYKKALDSDSSIRQSQRDWLRETRSCETANDIVSCLRERYVSRIAVLKASNQQTTTTADPKRPAQIVDSRISVLDGVWQSDEPKIGYTIKDGNAESLRDAFYGGRDIKKGEILLRLKPVSPSSFEGEQMFADGKFHPVTATLSNNDSLTFASADHGINWTVKRKVESNQNRQTTVAPTTASNAGATPQMTAEQQRMYDACANEFIANYSPESRKNAQTDPNSGEAVTIRYACSQRAIQEQRRIDEQNRQAAESERIAKAMADQRKMRQAEETERSARVAAEQEKLQQDKERQFAEQRAAAQSRVANSDKSMTSTSNQTQSPIVVDTKGSTREVRDNSGGSTAAPVGQTSSQVRQSYLIEIIITTLSTIVLIAIEFAILVLWVGEKFTVITANETSVGTLEYRDPEEDSTYVDSILVWINPSMVVPDGYSASHLQIGCRLFKNVPLPSEASYEALHLDGLVSAVFTRRGSDLRYLINHNHNIEIRGDNSRYAGYHIVVFFVFVISAFFAMVPTVAVLKAIGFDIYKDLIISITSIFVQCCAAVVILKFISKRNRENLESLIQETKTLNPKIRTSG